MFILDDNYFDSSKAISIISKNDRFEIIFPSESLNFLNGEWVWEIYFNDHAYLYGVNVAIVDATLVVDISQKIMDDLNWVVGEKLNWKILRCEDGPEVFLFDSKQ